MKGKSSLFTYRPKYASGDITFRSGEQGFFDYVSRRKDVDVNGVLNIVAWNSWLLHVMNLHGDEPFWKK